MAGLEARLVIKGVDETKGVFAEIEANVKRLSATVAAASKANGATGRSIGQAAFAREAVKSAGGAGALTSAVSAAAGLGAAFAGAMAVKEAVKAVAARQHEIVRMSVAGMSKSEIADATVAAAKLSAGTPNVSMTEAMHMLRNARSIVGTYQEAAEIAEPLMKLRTLAQLARPGEDVSEDFDQLVKGLEIKGVTQNPGQFREYMQGIAKGLNVFGDTLKPYQYYEMFKYGRQATPGLSEQFILGTAPTLAQELGGSSYGKAVSAFNAAIVGGVMKTKAVDEFYRLGLLKDEDVKTLKSGHKQIAAGHNVEGWKEAQSDPNAWVKDYLIPSLDKLGIKDKSDVLREVSTLFQNQMAGQMVGLLATQQSRIVKDTDLLHNAPGLEAADRAMREDPGLAWQGLKSAMESLAATLGDITGAALKLPNLMASTAEAIADFNAGILEHKQKQDAGQPDETIPRAMNKAMFGVDDPDADYAANMAAARASDADRRAELERLHNDYVNTKPGSKEEADNLKLQDDVTKRWLTGVAHTADLQYQHLIEQANKPFQNFMPPPPGRLNYDQKAYGERVASAGGPMPDRDQVLLGALRASEVRVFGDANVSIESKISVDASPELKAVIAAAAGRQNVTVPLNSAPTGRMDGDAAPHRGVFHGGGH